MSDKKVDLGCVVAWSLWGAVVALLWLSIAARDVYLATIGCAVAGAAATATVRTYFVRHEELLLNAFELGQDAAELPTPIPVQRIH